MECTSFTVLIILLGIQIVICGFFAFYMLRRPKRVVIGDSWMAFNYALSPKEVKNLSKMGAEIKWKDHCSNYSEK